MTRSLLSGAAFLACGVLVSGRPLSIRQEIKGLNSDSSWLNGGDWLSSDSSINLPSLPTLLNTNYKVASTLSSNPDELPEFNPQVSNLDGLPDFNPQVSSNLNGLPEFNPQVPTQSGLDTPIAINIPPSIDSSFQIASTPPDWVPDLYESLVSIENGKCEYGIYTIDVDAASIVVKECKTRSDRSNWKDLSNSLTRSGPAYAVVNLKNGIILCITSFIHDTSISDDELTLLKNSLLVARDAWLKVVQKVFPEAMPLGVNDPGHLATLMSRYGKQSLSVPGSFALNEQNSMVPTALYKRH